MSAKIACGTRQVTAMAEALKAGNVAGVAVLLVDGDAWSKLSATTQGAYFNQVNSAGAFIQVQQGLSDAAAKRAQQMVKDASQ